MTVIIGARYKGSLYMAADAQITNKHRSFLIKDKHEKLLICEIGDKKRPMTLTAGMSGNVTGMQDVKGRIKLPKIGKLDAKDYLIKKFVPALKKAWEEEDTYVEMLVGIDNRLFTVGGDYSVLELADDFAAVGSGEDYALGAMMASDHIEDIEERMRKAVKIAAHFVPSVSADCVFVEA